MHSSRTLELKCGRASKGDLLALCAESLVEAVEVCRKWWCKRSFLIGKDTMKRAIALLACIAAVHAPNALADTEAVDSLNELLRGERSAVETYNQALEKVGKDAGADTLRKGLSNHKEAVSEISAEIMRLGGKPAETSGAWGTWASTVTGTAKLFGDAAALKALKEGEEHGVKEYNEILEDDDVPAAFKEKIRNEFLPAQRQHITAIDGWLNKLS